MLSEASFSASQLSRAIADLGEDETIVLEQHESLSMKIDGHLDEPVWATLPAWDEFVVIDPDTLARPPHRTRVRLFYDSTGIYFGIDMDQPRETLVARLSGRDSRELSRDSINITLDTSGEGRYGYWFGLNLGDSLMDGTLLPERQFSSDWDGAWRGASQVTDNGWSGEFHIPWGTVAMPQVDDERRIGLYMSRKVAHLDERWGWPGLPSTVPKFISALQGLELAGVNPKQQYSIFPFIAVADEGVERRVLYRAGADFFWRPSSDFQVTATVNPDFGAVESDEVVINLSATETFFPEKRLFFLEGQQVFVTSPRADTRGMGVGRTGAPTTLINTRRIGGQPLEPPDMPGRKIPDRELLQPVDLMGAVKMTGQYKRLRYGLLTAFEDDVTLDVTQNGVGEQIEVDGSDYGVLRLFYEDEPGGAYKAVGLMSTATLNDMRDAMTHGLDVHYLSTDGKLKMDFQAYLTDIHSETERVETGLGGFLDFEYTFRQGVVQRLGIEYADEHADLNDLGFLQRKDLTRVRTAHVRTRSNLRWARDNQFDLRGFVQKNKADLFTGGGVFLSNRTVFDNLSSLVLRLSWTPESYDDLNSFDNGAFRIEEQTEFSMNWYSDSAKEFSYGFDVDLSEENLGGRTETGGLRMTWRPSDRFALRTRAKYRNRDGWLLHQEDRNFTSFQAEQWSSRISADYFISAKQQLRFSLQWVGVKAQEDKFYLIDPKPGDLIPTAKPAGNTDSFSLSQMSMQMRYRWEIAPLSDIFLVYTRLVDDSTALKSFSDTFNDGYGNPLADLLVFKMRYRFGS